MEGPERPGQEGNEPDDGGNKRRRQELGASPLPRKHRTDAESNADDGHEQERGRRQGRGDRYQQAQRYEPGPRLAPATLRVRRLPGQPAQGGKHPGSGGVPNEAGPVALRKGVVGDRQGGIQDGGGYSPFLRAERAGGPVDTERPERQRYDGQQMNGHVHRAERNRTDKGHEK